MKITAITAQIRNPDRLNISIDGKYVLSLDISQVIDFGIKIGLEIDTGRLEFLKSESEFGKLYSRALEYSLSRPKSVYELKNYLYRKTQAARYRSKKTGEIKERPGYTPEVAERVLTKLIDKGYVDDSKFADWWVENRNQTKGASLRKLRSELASKGVAPQIIDSAIDKSDRDDSRELNKVIAKKRQRYKDDAKFMQYLLRQGFSYDDIKSAMQDVD